MYIDNRGTSRSTDPNESIIFLSENNSNAPNSFHKTTNFNIISSLFKIQYKKKFENYKL